jgi:hypothetical protein
VQVVETRMLSFAFAGGDPIHDLPTTSGIPKKWRIPSLLHSIVKSNRPSLCGNATVRTTQVANLWSILVLKGDVSLLLWATAAHDSSLHSS